MKLGNKAKIYTPRIVKSSLVNTLYSLANSALYEFINQVFPTKNFHEKLSFTSDTVAILGSNTTAAWNRTCCPLWPVCPNSGGMDIIITSNGVAVSSLLGLAY